MSRWEKTRIGRGSEAMADEAAEVLAAFVEKHLRTDPDLHPSELATFIGEVVCQIADEIGAYRAYNAREGERRK